MPFTDLGAMTARGAGQRRRRLAGTARLEQRFIGGEAVERFEREWAAYCGTVRPSAWPTAPMRSS